MTHLKTSIFLALLCVLSGAQFFTPDTDFDVTRILGDPWYSLVWFNDRPDSTPYGCNSYQFTQTSDPGRIAYEYSYNYPDINGALNTGIYSLIPTDNSRVFDVIYNPVPRQLNILAYDEENYDWIVIGDTTAAGSDPWVDLLVRSVDNEDDNAAGMTRVEQEAAKYGLSARHDVNQGDTCPYEANREQLLAEKAAREEQQTQTQLFKPATGFDVTRIEGDPWYSIVYFNQVEDSTPTGCLSYQFTQSSNPNEIFYEYSYNYPDINGALNTGIYSLTPTDNSRVFDVTPYSVPRQLNILAYDEENYGWIVIGDTTNWGKDHWVDLLVRSLDDNNNSAGVARVEREAAKYGLQARHDIKQSDLCPYEANREDVIAGRNQLGN